MGSCSVAGLPTGANSVIWLKGVGKVSAAVLSGPWRWSKSVYLKLGSRAVLWKGYKQSGSDILQSHICTEKNLVFVFFSAHTLEDWRLSSWGLERLYSLCMCTVVKLGTCSRQCQWEGRAQSDLGLGPLGTLAPGRKWCWVNPMQTTPQTSANLGPNSRAFQPPLP